MSKRNENRTGYKKTKVGWIPDEWEVLLAGEVFDIQLGKMLSEKARQGNNPQPYLANYNVQWGRFDLSEIQKMDFSEREVEIFQLKNGDLLVCESGEVGRCAIWEEQHAIIDVLQAADSEINHLEKKLKTLEKQKRGLM